MFGIQSSSLVVLAVILGSSCNPVHSFKNNLYHTSSSTSAFSVLHQKSVPTRLHSTMKWSELVDVSKATTVGKALTEDAELRKAGYGAAHVDNKLRLFDKPAGFEPKITLYRDEAGWCPYCEKTILLVEEKRIPIKVETVPMRSYGDKPQEFMRMIPNGLLPALVVEIEGQKRVITESQVIMELLDRWFPASEGYVDMMPDEKKEPELFKKHHQLARLERDLFSWWCTLIFRPESRGGGGGGAFGGMFGGGNKRSEELSGAMVGFMECLDRVDGALLETPGPFFLGTDHPMMIDLIFVSHIERMLASCAYWKGLQIRGNGRWKGIDAWFDAFDQRTSYLGFKSDFYTNVMDIPPQYGPGYDGGFDDKREEFATMIKGRDGKSWNLPLSHDAGPLEPLFQGLPLPLCALEATGLTDYNNNVHSDAMAKACRQAAGWKLASNGVPVSRFAARGGSKGAKNPRKTFQAPLADPYADPDDMARPAVEKVLQLICQLLLEDETVTDEEHVNSLSKYIDELKNISKGCEKDVASSLIYLRDRVGVPRDMPLAAARHLRAHLNWAVDLLE